MLLTQVVEAAVHVLPPQHGCPIAAPQATQLPAEQMAPDPQVPPQQGWPTPPHRTQVLLVLQVLPVLQVEPPQHGCVAAPHAVQVPDVEPDVEQR